MPPLVQPQSLTVQAPHAGHLSHSSPLLHRRHALAAGVVGLQWRMSSQAQARVDEEEPAYIRTKSNILLQELVAGNGAQPKNGDLVLIDFVLRRRNGYFIYSTAEGISFQPRDVPIGPVAFVLGKDPTWIQGLQEVVGGMRQGGKSRALIPPSMGYKDCNKDKPQMPTYATQRQLLNHCQDDLLFEIALLRVTPSK